MATLLREVMTPGPTCLPESATVEEAAKEMRAKDIGDVIVLGKGGQIAGMLTDRDIVVRCVADGANTSSTRIGEISSVDLIALEPTDNTSDAVRVMRSYSIRRLPIVENGTPVGIVSIGDLAMERDPES